MADEKGGGGIPDVIARLLIDEATLDSVLARLETRFLTFESRVNRALSIALATDPKFADDIEKGFKSVESKIESLPDASKTAATQIESVFDTLFANISKGFETAISSAVNAGVSAAETRTRDLIKEIDGATTTAANARQASKQPPGPAPVGDSGLVPGITNQVGGVVGDVTSASGIKQRTDALKKLRDEFQNVPEAVKLVDRAIVELSNDAGTLEERLNRALSGGSSFSGTQRALSTRRAQKQKELQDAQDELRDLRRAEGPEAGEAVFAELNDKIAQLSSVVKNLDILERAAGESTKAFAQQFKELSQEARDVGQNIQKVGQGVKLVTSTVPTGEQKETAVSARLNAATAESASARERFNQSQQTAARSQVQASQHVARAAEVERDAINNLTRTRQQAIAVQESIATVGAQATQAEVTASQRLVTATTATEQARNRAAVSAQVHARRIAEADQRRIETASDVDAAERQLAAVANGTAQQRAQAEENLSGALGRATSARENYAKVQDRSAQAAQRNSDQIESAAQKEAVAVANAVAVNTGATARRAAQASREIATNAELASSIQVTTAARARFNASQVNAAQAAASSGQQIANAAQEEANAVNRLTQIRQQATTAQQAVAAAGNAATQTELNGVQRLTAAVDRTTEVRNRAALSAQVHARRISEADQRRIETAAEVDAAERAQAAVANGTAQQRAQAEQTLSSALDRASGARDNFARVQDRAAQAAQRNSAQVQTAVQQESAAVTNLTATNARATASRQARVQREAADNARLNQSVSDATAARTRFDAAQQTTAAASTQAAQQIAAASQTQQTAISRLTQIRQQGATAQQAIANAGNQATQTELNGVQRLIAATNRTAEVRNRSALSAQTHARRVQEADQRRIETASEVDAAERALASVASGTTAQRAQAEEGLATALDRATAARENYARVQDRSAQAAQRNSTQVQTAVQQEAAAVVNLTGVNNRSAAQRQTQVQNQAAQAAQVTNVQANQVASQQRLTAAETAAAQAAVANAQTIRNAAQQEQEAIDDLAEAQTEATAAQNEYAQAGDNASRSQVSSANSLAQALQRVQTVQQQNATAQRQAAQEVQQAAAAQAAAQQNLVNAQQRVAATRGGTPQQQAQAIAGLVQAQNQLTTSTNNLTRAQTAQANTQQRGSAGLRAAVNNVTGATGRLNAANRQLTTGSQALAGGIGSVHNNMLALLGVSRLLPGPIGQIVSGAALMTGAFRSTTGATIAIVGGLAALVLQLGATGLAFNKEINQQRVLAEGLGLTVTEVRALDFILKQSGGSVENFSVGIRNISEAIAGIGENSARAAQGLNVAFAGVKGFENFGFKSKTTTEVLLKFLERIQDPALANSGLSNVLTGGVLGRNFDEIKGRAKDVTDQFDKYEKKLRAAGITSQQAVADARAQQRALADLDLAWSTLQLRLAKPLTGVINFIVKGAEAVTNFIGNLIPVATDSQQQTLSPSQQAVDDGNKKLKFAVTEREKVGDLIDEAGKTISEQDKLGALNDVILERKQITAQKISEQVKIDKDSLAINEDSLVTLKATLERQKQAGFTAAQIQETVDFIRGIEGNITRARINLLASLQAQNKINLDIGRLRGTRTGQQNKEATARQSTLEQLREESAEALQELASDQAQTLDTIQGRVSRNEAATFELLDQRRVAAEQIIKRTTELLGSQIDEIDRQLAVLKTNSVKFIEGTDELNPLFDPQAEEETLKLQRERGKLVKDLQKSVLSSERDIAKIQIEALNSVAKAERNRLEFSLRILDAEQRRVALLKEFGGINESQERARLLALDRERLKVLEAQGKIFKGDLRNALTSLGVSGNRAGAQAAAESLQAGSSQQTAAEIGARVAKEFIEKRLNSDEFIELRGKILDNDQARVELQARLQFTDSILGRISDGLGKVADTLDSVADRLFNAESILGKENLQPKSIEQQAEETAAQLNAGLGRILRGAKGIADIFLGQRVRKGLPELTAEAAEKFRDEVFRSGSEFYVRINDAATVLKNAADVIARKTIEREQKPEPVVAPPAKPTFPNETEQQRLRRIAIGDESKALAASPTVIARVVEQKDSPAVVTLKTALNEFRDGIVAVKQKVGESADKVQGSDAEQVALQLFKTLESKVDEFSAEANRIFALKPGSGQDAAIRSLLAQMQRFNNSIENARGTKSNVFTSQGVKFEAREVTVVTGTKPVNPAREAKLDETQKANRDLAVSTANLVGANQRVIEELFFLESAFKSEAKSPTGPRGVPQFTTATGRRAGLTINARVDERLNPEKAIPAGVKFFQSLLNRYNGDYVLALTAYNQGEGVVDAFLKFKAERSEPRLANTPITKEAFPFTSEGRKFASTILGRSGIPGSQIQNVGLPAIPPIVPGTAGLTPAAKANLDKIQELIKQTREDLEKSKENLGQLRTASEAIDRRLREGPGFNEAFGAIASDLSRDGFFKSVGKGLKNFVTGNDKNTTNERAEALLREEQTAIAKKTGQLNALIRRLEQKVKDLQEQAGDISEQTRIENSFKIRDPFARPPKNTRPVEKEVTDQQKAQAAAQTQKQAKSVTEGNKQLVDAAISGNKEGVQKAAGEVKRDAGNFGAAFARALAQSQQQLPIRPLRVSFPEIQEVATDVTSDVKPAVKQQSKGFLHSLFDSIFNGLDSEADRSKNEAVSLGKRLTSSVFGAITDLIQGFTAGTTGGKVAGFGAAAGSIIGAFRPALGGMIGQITGILGGVIDFIGGIFRRRAERIAAATERNFQTINDKFRDGALTLGETIDAMRKEVEAARPKLTSGKVGKKGGRAAFAQLEAQANQQIAELRRQQKQIQDNFAEQLDLLRQDPEVRGVFTAVKDVFSKVREYLNSFDDKAEALKHLGDAEEYFRLSLGEMSDKAHDELKDLLQQQIDADRQFQKSRLDIINEGRVQTEFQADKDRITRLFELEEAKRREDADRQKQRSALEDQLSIIDRAVQKAEKFIDKFKRALDDVAAKLEGVFGKGGDSINLNGKISDSTLQRALAINSARAVSGKNTTVQTASLEINMNLTAGSPSDAARLTTRAVEQTIQSLGLINPGDARINESRPQTA